MEILAAQTIRLKQERTFLRTEFRKIGASTSGASGASTPGACGASTPGQAQGHCIVSVLHTRSGSANTGHKINHPNPLEFKLDRTRWLGWAHNNKGFLKKQVRWQRAKSLIFEKSKLASLSMSMRVCLHSVLVCLPARASLLLLVARTC